MKRILRKLIKITCKILLVLFALSFIVTLAYKWINPPITPLMISRTSGSGINKTWKNIDEISPEMIAAVIASEDNFFLGHKGFDTRAIKVAIEEYESGKRKYQRGASTISQQTAKNVFLWQGRSWLRKGLEVYFTFLIESLWSKERIMEVYLNVIETGDGIYGVEAASQVYFQKSAKNLSRRQASLIAACLPNPRKRNAGTPSTYLQKRANQIMLLISKIGDISFNKENLEKSRKRYKEYSKKK